tara:strand:+ start:66 stop:293 length:228 start_codon:yes stop_codon:yes gene_type:complete
MGESIRKVIEKTDLVIMSCENNEQLLVAEKYADQAEKFMLNMFGSELTSVEGITYADFRKSNKYKISAKRIMIKK